MELALQYYQTAAKCMSTKPAVMTSTHTNVLRLDEKTPSVKQVLQGKINELTKKLQQLGVTVASPAATLTTALPAQHAHAEHAQQQIQPAHAQPHHATAQPTSTQPQTTTHPSTQTSYMNNVNVQRALATVTAAVHGKLLLQLCACK